MPDILYTDSICNARATPAAPVWYMLAMSRGFLKHADGVDIVKFLCVLQGAQQSESTQLPLAHQRGPDGHLFCSNVAQVPDKTVLSLKYPIHLGSLSLPVLVRACTSGCNTVELLGSIQNIQAVRISSTRPS